MIKIVKPTDTDSISLDKITDQNWVGITIGETRYLVVSRYSNICNIEYCRMNDNLHTLKDGHASIQSLLSDISYTEAFLFNTKDEAIKWLFD